MWRHQAETLTALGHTVITPDLPGHGARMDERFTLAGGIATIEAAVADAPGPVFLGGFSLGGYLAAGRSTCCPTAASPSTTRLCGARSATRSSRTT
jgi:hypothetical protein